MFGILLKSKICHLHKLIPLIEYSVKPYCAAETVVCFPLSSHSQIWAVFNFFRPIISSSVKLNRNSL